MSATPKLVEQSAEHLREQVRALGEGAAFSVVDRVPEVVAVTLRREVAGQTWDITLIKEWAWASFGKKARSFRWEARAGDIWDGSTEGFDTPEAALADALFHLAP